MPPRTLAFLSITLLLTALVCPTARCAPLPAERIATATNTMPFTYQGQAAFRVSDGRTKAYIVPARGRAVVFGWVGGTNLLAPPPAAADDVPAEASVLPDRRLRLVFPVQAATGTRATREYYYNPAGELVMSESVEKVSGPPVAIPLRCRTRIAAPLCAPLCRTSGEGAAIAAVYDGGIFLQRATFPAGPAGGSDKPAPVADIPGSVAPNEALTTLEIASYMLKVGDTARWSVRWSLHRLPPGDAAASKTRAEVERLLAAQSGV